MIVSDLLPLYRFCLKLKTPLTDANLERKSSHGAEGRGDKETRRGEEFLTFILFIFTILAFILIRYQCSPQVLLVHNLFNNLNYLLCSYFLH